MLTLSVLRDILDLTRDFVECNAAVPSPDNHEDLHIHSPAPGIIAFRMESVDQRRHFGGDVLAREMMAEARRSFDIPSHAMRLVAEPRWGLSIYFFFHGCDDLAAAHLDAFAAEWERKFDRKLPAREAIPMAMAA